MELHIYFVSRICLDFKDQRKTVQRQQWGIFKSNSICSAEFTKGSRRGTSDISGNGMKLGPKTVKLVESLPKEQLDSQLLFLTLAKHCTLLSKEGKTKSLQTER